MIVYKTVRERRGEYYSLIQEVEQGLGLRYKIGETTVPEIGLIFAYKTISRARDWAGVVLKCKTPSAKPLRYQASHDDPDEQVAFWLGEKVRKISTEDSTVGCPELTPIEVVR